MRTIILAILCSLLAFPARAQSTYTAQVEIELDEQVVDFDGPFMELMFVDLLQLAPQPTAGTRVLIDEIAWDVVIWTGVNNSDPDEGPRWNRWETVEIGFYEGPIIMNFNVFALNPAVESGVEGQSFSPPITSGNDPVVFADRGLAPIDLPVGSLILDFRHSSAFDSVDRETTITGTLTLTCRFEARFDTIITLPEDQQTLDTSVPQRTEVRIAEGGSIVGPGAFEAGPADQTGENVLITLAGGSIDSPINVNAGAELSLFTGNVAGPINVAADGALRLNGRRFTLNGQDITPPIGSDPVVIPDRAGTLEVQFNDDSTLTLELASIPAPGQGAINPGASLILDDGFGAVFNLPQDQGAVFQNPPNVVAGEQVNVVPGAGVSSLRDTLSPIPSTPFGQVAEVNIDGGLLNNGIRRLNANTRLRLLGGKLSSSANGGKSIQTEPGSTFKIYGTDFRANGVPVTSFEDELGFEIVQFARFDDNGNDISFSTIVGDTLSGVLQDGTSFLFSRDLGDFTSAGTVELIDTGRPPVDPMPFDIDTPGTLGIRPGQTARLLPGGVLPNNFALASATLEIAGGAVGDAFRAAFAEVTMTSGTVGSAAQIVRNTTFQMSGGSIGAEARLESGGRLNLNGGTVGERITVASGAIVLVDGGTIGPNAVIGGGEIVVVSGEVQGRSSPDRNELTMPADGVLSIYGGRVGDAIVELRAVIDLYGGSIGEVLLQDDPNQVTPDAPVMNIFGGTYGSVGVLGVANIYGGSPFSPTTTEISVSSNGIVNLYGGGTARVRYGASGPGRRDFNIFGTELLRDAVPVQGLVPGEPFEIVGRTGTISGTLADGSAFSYNLAAFGSGTISDISFTLVDPIEPADINFDGAADIFDLIQFLRGFDLGVQDYNGDGITDQADLDEFLADLDTP